MNVDEIDPDTFRRLLMFFGLKTSFFTRGTINRACCLTVFDRNDEMVFHTACDKMFLLSHRIHSSHEYLSRIFLEYIFNTMYHTEYGYVTYNNVRYAYESHRPSEYLELYNKSYDQTMIILDLNGV